MTLSLRKVFLYIFASVGLLITVIGAVQLINLGLKQYVFTQADNYCYEMSPSGVKDPNSTLTLEEQRRQDAENVKRCEQQKTSAKQSQASNAIAMLIVGAPLYLYHWNTIRKDKSL